MRILLLVISALTLYTLAEGANLSVDASKKKNPRIIKPVAFETKQNSKFQNKRYASGKIKSSPVIHSDSRVSFSTQSPGDSINASNDQMARLNESAGNKKPRVLDQLITSSDEFEKAYREALTVELSKRAAAQVKITKTKADLEQRDINRDAKVKRSQREGFKVQQAGSDTQ